MADQKETFQKQKNPVIAAFLAIIPGLGSLYNGNLIKTTGIALVFAAMIVMITRSPYRNGLIFGLSIGVFYIYQIIDSFNEANRTRKKPDALPKDDQETISLYWACIVLGLGVIFLLANLGLYGYREIIRFSPLLLIVFGAKLVLDYFHKEVNHETSKR